MHPKQLGFAWAHMCVSGKYLHGSKTGAARRQQEQQHVFLREKLQKLDEKEHMLLSLGLQGSPKSAPGGSRRAGDCSPPHRASSAQELKASASNLLIYPEFFSLIVFIVGAIWTRYFISLE